MAIGNYKQQFEENCNILYFSSLDFISDYVSACQTESFESFTKKYYNDYDVILIDDIQMFEKKKKSEDEFFKLFENYYNQKKLIVVTSDKVSSDLQDIQPRLKSRLNWGISAFVDKPSQELRLKILNSKFKLYFKEQGDIPLSALTRISQLITDNVRSLEGALNSVVMYITSLDLDFTTANVDKALETVLSKKELSKKNGSLYFDLVRDEVCRYLSLSLEEFKSDSRKKVISYARRLSIYIYKTVYNAQLTEIAKYLNKDHSTISYALSAINTAIKTDKNIKTDYNNVISKIKKN
jgi:chromosomal replication initiator protein